MGCCVSTNRGSNFQKKEHFRVGSEEAVKSKSTHESRAPPPSIDQEETVKEVLSETPQPKPKPSVPQPIIKTLLPQKQQHQDDDNKKIHSQPAFLDENVSKENGDKNEKIASQEEEMVSEQDVSEVCSLSLSESVSTTTVTNDRRDDDDEDVVMKQRVMRSPSPKLPQRNRAFSGDLGPRRDRVVGKSPTWRSEQSPNKRNNAGGGGGGSLKLVQSRELSTSQVGRRGGLRPDPNRRDPGESSGRRSRSPAANRSALGRSPSKRRTNMSPGRVSKDPPESGGSNNMKVENGTEPKWPSTNTNGTTSESLENPLVSLECFIFL